MFFKGRERERKREATCTPSGAGHASQTLSRPETRQGQASVERRGRRQGGGGGKKKRRKTLHQVWQIQISVFNCCFGGREQGWACGGRDEPQRKEMDISWLSVSEQCFDEWLPSYRSSIIRQLNTCCLQMLNKIKLSHNDLRVRIPLLLYNQSFARLDTFCVQFFFFFSLNEAICL